MSTDHWAVRPLSDRDLPELFQLDNAAFHIDAPQDFLDDVVRPMIEVGRLTGVRDPDERVPGRLGGDPVYTAYLPRRAGASRRRRHLRGRPRRVATPRHPHRPDARPAA